RAVRRWRRGSWDILGRFGWDILRSFGRWQQLSVVGEVFLCELVELLLQLRFIGEQIAERQLQLARPRAFATRPEQPSLEELNLPRVIDERALQRLLFPFE